MGKNLKIFSELKYHCLISPNIICKLPNFKQCKCAPKGDCLCDKGYIRSKLGGPCIPIEKCPKNNTCGENEEPTDCGNVCTEPNCPVGQSFN